MKSIMSGSGITVVFSDGPRMIHKSSPYYESALKALEDGDHDSLMLLMDQKLALKKYTENGISFNNDGSIAVHGNKVGETYLKLVEHFYKNSLPWAPLNDFFYRLSKNPSARARIDLENAMSSNHFAITQDGHLLAYKLVSNEWIDTDTKSSITKPGKLMSTPRENISMRARYGYGRGFSAGGKDYISYNSRFVGKTIIVQIDPTDVVGVLLSPVPEIICCSYLVISELKEMLTDSLCDVSNLTSLSKASA